MVTNISLSLRQVMGSGLAWSEVDANFVALRDAILTVAAALNLSRFVFGAEPALGERPGTGWIPTDRSGFFAWNTTTSKWDRIREPVLYATATGSANNYAVTVPGITALSELTGRIWTFVINHENTGASQLNVNGLGLTGLLYNGAALTNAMLRVGRTAIVQFDGSNFQVLNPAIDIPSAASMPTFQTIADITIPAQSTKVDLTHSLAKMPCMVRLVAVCTAAIDGYSIGDELGAECITGDLDGGAEDAAAYGVSATATGVTISAQKTETESAGNAWYPAKAGGQADWTNATITVPSWKFKVYLMAAP